MDIPASFGDWLRQRRKTLDLTQEELAQRAGLATTTVRKIESDARRPSREVAAKLAEVLGLPLAERAAFVQVARAALRVDRLDTPFITAPPAPPTLPLALTPFIGRQRLMVETAASVRAERLVTLVGPGGSGKTRLSVEVAATLLASYPDGVWLVELAALNEPALLLQAVAASLGVREGAGAPLADTLLRELRPRRMLLLLDNCEHLVAETARLAELLLRSCPHLHILATSREPLQIPGEVVWPVPPLDLPAPDQQSTFADLIGCEAVQLFALRAQAASPAFRLTAENAPVVAQICARLDGMPLAIELAAACVPVLSVEQLAARLDDRLHLLVGGSRTAQRRQQTLRGALDWSHDLLSPSEQMLFRRLAIFAGGWTLEAAEAICADTALAPTAVLGLLVGLVHKSLVVVRGEGAQRRYALLETVRQYALEQLHAAGEGELLADGHLRWYVAFAREGAKALHGPEQATWLDRLGQERENLRAALEWSYSHRGGDDGLRLSTALYWYWYLSSSLSEGRGWFERALARTSPGEASVTRAAALTGVGAMALYQGDLATTYAVLNEAITLWREQGSTYGLGLALFGMGMAALNGGDDALAQQVLEESRVLFKQRGLEWPHAMTLLHLGDVALNRGHYAAARARYEESLAVQRRLGNSWGVAQLSNTLGEVARCVGDYAEAGRCYAKSLALFRTLGTSGDIARVLHNQGYVARAAGDNAAARALFAESLATFRERGGLRGIAECLIGLAGLVGPDASPEVAWQAALLLAAAEAHLAASGAALWPADRREHGQTVAALTALLGPAAFAAARAEGAALSLEAAVALSRAV